MARRGSIPTPIADSRRMLNGGVRPLLRTLAERPRTATSGYSRALEDQYETSRHRYAGQASHSLGTLALAGRFAQVQIDEKWRGITKDIALTEEEIEEMIALGKVVRDRIEDSGQEPVDETDAWVVYQQQIAWQGLPR